MRDTVVDRIEWDEREGLTNVVFRDGMAPRPLAGARSLAWSPRLAWVTRAQAVAVQAGGLALATGLAFRCWSVDGYDR